MIQNLLSWQYGNQTTLPWGISASDPNYRYHPINVYLLIIIVPALLRIWTSSYVLGQGRALCNFLIFYGLGWLAVSLFQPQEAVFLYLSIEQIVYILMAAAGAVISYFLVKLPKNIA
jgi:prolipoprotein diacylglyceryltransferase